MPPEKSRLYVPPLATSWGLSVVCSAGVTVRSTVGVPTKPVPSALSCTPQTCEAAADEPSFDFHTRYGTWVVGSTKGLGSRTPPAGHHGDPDELSVNTGEEGVSVAAVATARQLNPESAGWPASDASYHMTQWPPMDATPGDVWVSICCQAGTFGSAVEPKD